MKKPTQKDDAKLLNDFLKKRGIKKTFSNSIKDFYKKYDRKK